MRHARTTGTAAVIAITLATAGWAADPPEAYDKKCKVCHSLKGEGGKQADKGGPLDGVGAKRDAAWLKAYIEDPKSRLPEGKMPKLKLTPEELDALVAYLAALK